MFLVFELLEELEDDELLPDDEPLEPLDLFCVEDVLLEELLLF